MNFLFYFLFVVMVFWIVPKNLKMFTLFLSSVFWVITWKLSWAYIFLGVSLFNYLCLYFLSNKEGQRNIFYSFLLIVNIIFFGVFKLGKLGHFHLETPYGISFFMFIHMGYIIDLWRSNKKFEIENVFHFLSMPIFFPLLMGGPIVRGREFFPQVNQLKQFSIHHILDGILIFAFGFAKYFYLSKELVYLNKGFEHMMMEKSFSVIIAMGIFGTFQAFVDFSSFCDMGRGVAKCFGIDLAVNFKALYYAKNPNDYWQRWNISLGTWIRDYISFPMMLKWGRKINQNFILILSFILVGLWHGLTLNWLVFGLFNGLIVVGYNFFIKRHPTPMLGKVFVLLIFIGNGLLQRAGFLSDLVLLMSSYKPWNPGDLSLFGMLSDNLHRKFIYFTLFLFAFEFYQEKRKDSDWFIKLNVLIKAFLVILFLYWIVSGLNQGQFIDDVILPPAYFRI